MLRLLVLFIGFSFVSIAHAIGHPPKTPTDFVRMDAAERRKFALEIDEAIEREEPEALADLPESFFYFNFRDKWNDWVARLFERGTIPFRGKVILSSHLVRETHPKWEAMMDEYLEQIFEQSRRGLGGSFASALQLTFQEILSNAIDDPRLPRLIDKMFLMSAIQMNKALDGVIFKAVLSNPKALIHPQWSAWVDTLIIKGMRDHELKNFLELPHVRTHQRHRLWQLALYSKSQDVRKTVLNTEPLQHQVPSFWIESGVVEEVSLTHPDYLEVYLAPANYLDEFAELIERSGNQTLWLYGNTARGYVNYVARHILTELAQDGLIDPHPHLGKSQYGMVLADFALRMGNHLHLVTSGTAVQAKELQTHLLTRLPDYSWTVRAFTELSPTELAALKQQSNQELLPLHGAAINCEKLLTDALIAKKPN